MFLWNVQHVHSLGSPSNAMPLIMFVHGHHHTDVGVCTTRMYSPLHHTYMYEAYTAYISIIIFHSLYEKIFGAHMVAQILGLLKFYANFKYCHFTMDLIPNCAGF